MLYLQVVAPQVAPLAVSAAQTAAPSSESAVQMMKTAARPRSLLDILDGSAECFICKLWHLRWHHWLRHRL